MRCPACGNEDGKYVCVEGMPSHHHVPRTSENGSEVFGGSGATRTPERCVKTPGGGEHTPPASAAGSRMEIRKCWLIAAVRLPLRLCRHRGVRESADMIWRVHLINFMPARRRRCRHGDGADDVCRWLITRRLSACGVAGATLMTPTTVSQRFARPHGLVARCARAA